MLSGGNVDINMLARVVEHGLMQAGRYFSLTVGVDDKPGQLALLAQLLSETGANVLSVAHHRFGIALPVGRVQVVLMLEVRNEAHADEVRSALETRRLRARVRGPARSSSLAAGSAKPNQTLRRSARNPIRMDARPALIKRRAARYSAASAAAGGAGFVADAGGVYVAVLARRAA